MPFPYIFLSVLPVLAFVVLAFNLTAEYSLGNHFRDEQVTTSVANTWRSGGQNIVQITVDNKNYEFIDWDNLDFQTGDLVRFWKGYFKHERILLKDLVTSTVHTDRNLVKA